MPMPDRLDMHRIVFEPLEPRLLLSGTIYLVNSLADSVASDGVVTLREAIEAANTNTPVYDAPAGSSTDVDLITFDQVALSAEAGVPVGDPLTITLGGTQFTITDDLDIQGLGQDVLTIDADGLSRVFRVSGKGIQVALGDLTITGGGIHNDKGSLTLTCSTISRSTLGGIRNYYGVLVLTNSTVSGNSRDYAGGIDNMEGVVTLTNSTVSGNSATTWDAGGIRNNFGTLTLTNSLVSGNTAEDDGGGITNRYGVVTLTNSTVSGNSAKDEGGGIYNDDDGTVILSNAIVAVNDATRYANIRNGYGLPTSNSSLVGGDPGFVRNPSPGTDGVWGTADDDPGDLRLVATSPAVDAGDNALLPADEFDLDGDANTLETLPVDLAGDLRIRTGFVDMGAYEFVPDGTTYVVNSLADVVATDGVLTLREAIEAANTNLSVHDAPAGSEAAVDFITFDRDALEAEAGLGNPLTILLGGTLLTITDDVRINGLRSKVLSIDADDLSRVLQVSGAFTEVVLNDLTITGGTTTTDGGGIYNQGLLSANRVTVSDSHAAEDGGGIYNGGTLALTESTVSGSSGNRGGGIFNAGGTLNLSSAVISDNLTTGSDPNGAGISSRYGTLTLADTTLSNNSTDGTGGGIHSYQDTLTVMGSTVTRNSAVAGGGIWSALGELTLVNTTVSDNSAAGPDSRGGGLWSALGMLRVVNSVAVGNTADGQGGGMYGGAGTYTLTNATVAGNAADQGGGIHINAGTLTVNNTIVALNEAPTSAEIEGAYTGNSSLVGGDPGFLRNPSPGTDGQWGTEDDDCGDLRLLGTSPARDAGNNALLPADEFDLDGDDDASEPLPLDFAGRQRIRHAVVDIGVYEYHLPGDANDDGKVDGGDIAIWSQNYDPMGRWAPHAWREGNWNMDDKVDGADLALWQQHYDPLGIADAGSAPVEESARLVGSEPAPMADEIHQTTDPLPTATVETEAEPLATVPAVPPEASVLIDDEAAPTDPAMSTTRARWPRRTALPADDTVDVLMLAALDLPL